MRTRSAFNGVEMTLKDDFMASVEFRPGDTLNIVWTSTQDTPLGVREVESSFAFTYDELLSKLQSTKSNHKSRRSGTNGARFSRVVALSTNALRKGKWFTGADIDRDDVFRRMISKFRELESIEYNNMFQMRSVPCSS